VKLAAVGLQERLDRDVHRNVVRLERALETCEARDASHDQRSANPPEHG